jgi:hypothetical protein
MKYLIIATFAFIASSCLAVNYKLIDGVNKYEIAVNNLKKVEFDMESETRELEYCSKKINENKSSYFISDNMDKFYKKCISETNAKINMLNIQYTKAKKTVKELEPIKVEYDKQIQLEHEKEEFDNKLWHIVWYITVLLIFAISTFLALFIYKRSQRFYQMMKDGKLSKEEYEKLMESHRASTINSDGDSSFRTYGVRYSWWR